MNGGQQVAVGRRTLSALGLERSWQRGGAGLLAYDPVLPTGGRLRQQRSENPSVNRFGVGTKGTPGNVMGDYPFEALLTADLAIKMGYSVLGSQTRTEPIPGVFAYDIRDAGDNSHADVSWFGYGGLPPIYRQQLFGIRFMDFSFEVQPNSRVTLKCAGKATHGTDIGPAEPDLANTGTSVPLIRGRMADPTKDIFLRVTGVANGRPQFEVEVADVAPAWPGTIAYDSAVDSSGDGVWQNLRDQVGNDVGRFDEAMVRVEVHFGDAAALANYAVGDVFRFARPQAWPTPALVQAGGRGFTNAHYYIDVRRAESSDEWIRVRRTKAKGMCMTELHENRGDGSNYVHQLYHTGVYDHTLEVERDYTDGVLDAIFDSDTLLEVRHGFVGAILDPATETRERIEWFLPAMEVTELTSTAQNPGATKESVKLAVRPDPAGEEPIRMSVITDVDWVPPAP